MVCSGTFEQVSYEDVLGAGALCDLVWNGSGMSGISDSTLLVRQIFQLAQNNLLAAASQSRNARRLLAIPELKDDVAFCLQRDVFDFAAVLNSEGKIVIA